MEEILHSGFLTKSPPERKINRARWQRRWFVLKRNPKAIYLQYFKDETAAKPKGTIDLNTCEQVDQGLTFESRRSLAKAFIFDIVTPKRKYFLVSNTEEDMIRWVREICQACGFMLDTNEDDLSVSPGSPTQPIDVTQSPGDRYTSQPYPASAPAVPAEVAESYIPLDECVTGENNDLSQSVPANGGWDGTGNREDVFNLDLDTNRPHSSGSNSSIPADTAPLPPSLDRDSATMENYDIPPALRRPGSMNVQPMYDIPPALLKREPSLKNQDDIYKPVPTPRLADLDSSIPSSFTHHEQNQLNGDRDDFYAVPPSRNSGGLYDIPPAHPLIKSQNQEMSSSTDKLAHDFQQISVRNSRGASDDSPFDLYSVPPSGVRNATDVLTSPSDGSLESTVPPPRPPKPDSTAATISDSPPMATPPRPPKPEHLKVRPSTPPPSLDDSYDVLPGQSSRPVPPQELAGRLQQAPIYSVPPGASTNWNDIRSPPNGHQWLDSKVPTPGLADHRYINTRLTHVSVPPKSAGYVKPRAVPPPQPQRAATFDSDVRYGPAPTTQESYLPMIGSSDSSNVFQYPDNSQYMPMEGSNNSGLRPDGRLFSDTQMDSYAVMSSRVPSEFAVYSRPLPPNFHRQTFSGGERPPPIDRSLKPDRRISEGGPWSANHIGMAGSFYAKADDIDLRPIQSDRTRSFSRRPGQYENRPDPDLTPFRGRSNTGGSTTSSSSDDMYGVGDGELHYPRQVPALPEEDTYIYKDVPPMGVLPERPLSDGLSSKPIPASLLSEQKDDIEYLELSHEEEPRQPPPRPPKPDSPKVQYIDLDLQRMQALKQVTERREEEKDGSMSGRSTLTRRDV